MNRCSQPTDSDEICGQPTFGRQLCSYHQKRAEGLIGEPSEYLESEVEEHAVLWGRVRDDGRRLDQYVLEDPCDWDPDGLLSLE